MKTVCLVFSLLFFNTIFGQSLSERIGKSVSQLEQESQFEHAIISLYIVDGKTGRSVFEKNAQVGLAPASCQKVVTSAAAFELLGKEYQYKTLIKIRKSNDSTCLLIDASGDPTMGSWRWESTKMDNVYRNITAALKKNNINLLGSDVLINNSSFTHQPVPDGWVWQDIGNYYGAGAWPFNWHENQYELALISANSEGTPTTIKSFDPVSAEIPVSNYITSGKKGSGDNAYIYSAPYNPTAFATGTIPPGQNNFTISGSMPDPGKVFIKGLRSYLMQNNIAISEGSNTGFLIQGTSNSSEETILTVTSPPMDSINYWFLKKSVNLYGEALVKTIAYEKATTGSTDTGVAIIKDFWSRNGVEKSALNIIDGSGLSPANRVTTIALVKVLQYAKGRPWFSSFYNALPEINGIKMKDGYIGGVRSYAGYVKSKSGNEYIFSFIVNNFDGSPGSVREKMWKILDLLK